MVDGFGVELKDRMTDIAETQSDMDFMNFGVAGNFGPVQQWLLYKELAVNFEHEEVHIFFFPSNDFDENQPENFPVKRYRPYLRKKVDSTFEVYYTVPFLERVVAKQMPHWRVIRRTITNSVYLFNALRQLGAMFEASDFKDSIADALKSQQTPSYNDYSKDELDVVKYTYEQIIKIANGKRVRIFVVPREREFIQYDEKVPFRVVADLKEFAQKFKNVEVHDLLPVFLKYAIDNQISYEKFFLACDPHWSALGNKVAAGYLASVVDG